jgi:hypothetical protein
MRAVSDLCTLAASQERVLPPGVVIGHPCGACAVFRPARGNELFSHAVPLHVGVTDAAGARVYNFDSGGACVNDGHSAEWARCVSLPMLHSTAVCGDAAAAEVSTQGSSVSTTEGGAVVSGIGAVTDDAGSDGDSTQSAATTDAACTAAASSSSNTFTCDGGLVGACRGARAYDGSGRVHTHASVATTHDTETVGDVQHASTVGDVQHAGGGAPAWDEALAEFHAEWRSTQKRKGDTATTGYDAHEHNCYDYVVAAANRLGVGAVGRRRGWTRWGLCVAGWDGVLRGVELHDELLARVNAAGGTLYHRTVLGRCRFTTMPPDEANPAAMLTAPAVEPLECALCSMAVSSIASCGVDITALVALILPRPPVVALVLPRCAF